MTNAPLHVEVFKTPAIAIEMMNSLNVKDKNDDDITYTLIISNMSYYSLLKIVESGVLYFKSADIDDVAVKEFGSELLMRLKQKSNNSTMAIEGLKIILTDLFYIREDSDQLYGDFDSLLNILIHDIKNVKNILPIYKKTSAVIIVNTTQLNKLTKIDNQEIHELYQLIVNNEVSKNG